MKIAIVKLSALGDVVHAMVVLQYIKKYNQAIEVDWIVEESFKELLEFNPDISKVHSVNLKKIKNKKSFFLLCIELRRLRNFGPYDIVIDMQGLIKSAIISRLIPSKLTLGFDKSSARERLASIFYNKAFKYGYDENVIERNFELVKFALDFPFTLEELDYKLPFLYSGHKYSNPSLSNIKKNIILIPGASFSSKRYPVESFAKFTNLLDANYLVIWGSDEEKLLADKIKNLAPHVHICEKLPIEALISLASQANLIVGPDTGPTHMGWALNIPSITLFGPTPGYRNTWNTATNKIIESKSDVNPHRINKNDYSINNISVDEVVKIAKGLLY
ncbi:lipopolysaccharide heptosyltransferase I [Candidatus Thioglobus sp.]|nr:lipopolysaccharide heptosyltransferase I [Candidatus Thioglobus sp.]